MIDYYENKDEKWKGYLDDVFFGPLTYRKIRSEALRILDSEGASDCKFVKRQSKGKELIKDNAHEQSISPVGKELVNDNSAIFEDILAKQDKMLETQHNFDAALAGISANINVKEQDVKCQEMSGKLDNVVSLLESLSDQLYKQRKKVKKVESLLKKSKKHKDDSDADDGE